VLGKLYLEGVEKGAIYGATQVSLLQPEEHLGREV
jgi:hypothetical protein